jgi:hypothetical protein
MTLPLTKTLNPADLLTLTDELDIVDSYPLGSEQHPCRRWEYAMCVLAVREWLKLWPTELPPIGMDVGGTGSCLKHILTDRLGVATRVLDPRENETLREYRDAHPPVCFPLVTCISTIEHVPEEDYWAFVTDLASLVMCGGLLFLTSDIKKRGAGDKKHFHWMRERIYTPIRWGELASIIESHGLSLFGDIDWRYNGDHVYDYSFCSMALIKEAV